jgi:hypothetical protein
MQIDDENSQVEFIKHQYYDKPSTIRRKRSYADRFIRGDCARRKIVGKTSPQKNWRRENPAANAVNPEPGTRNPEPSVTRS